MSDSFEREIAAFASGSDWRALISEACSLAKPIIRVEEITPWERGGAETYCHLIRLITTDESKSVFMKAFVPFPGTLSVAEALERTLRRTSTLLQAGLRVPEVYAVANGTILTQYIEESLMEALRRSPYETAETAANYLRDISELGCDVSFCVHDLRFSDHRPYLVDLGADFRDSPGDAEDSLQRTMRAFGRVLQSSSRFSKSDIAELTKGGR